jgi:hypothetical protein
MWAMGNNDRFARATVWELGPVLVEACGVAAGQRVLDVAAGTGNVAIPAALTGASVVASRLDAGTFHRRSPRCCPGGRGPGVDRGRRGGAPVRRCLVRCRDFVPGRNVSRPITSGSLTSSCACAGPTARSVSSPSRLKASAGSFSPFSLLTFAACAGRLASAAVGRRGTCA